MTGIMISLTMMLETRKKIASLLALADTQPKQESAVSSLNKLDKFVGGHICQSFYLAVKGRVTHAHLVGTESDRSEEHTSPFLLKCQ